MENQTPEIRLEPAEEKKPVVLTYGDLSHLADALSIASESHLMALEEARMIWKRHLMLVGWKAKQPQTPAVEESTVTRKSTRVKIQTSKEK